MGDFETLRQAMFEEHQPEDCIEDYLPSRAGVSKYGYKDYRKRKNGNE